MGKLVRRTLIALFICCVLQTGHARSRMRARNNPCVNHWLTRAGHAPGNAYRGGQVELAAPVYVPRRAQTGTAEPSTGVTGTCVPHVYCVSRVYRVQSARLTVDVQQSNKRGRVPTQRGAGLPV